MAKETGIKYNTVTALDITVAMKASATSTNGARKVNRADATVWNQTVAQSMELFSLKLDDCVGNSDENLKLVREHLMENMEKCIHEAYPSFPETGKDRDGKTITLLNDKTNKIKWSSWEESRRIWAYLGDIAKVITHGKADELYPETNKVAARCDILAACKGTASDIDNIKRLINQLAPYLAKVTGADSIEAQGLVDGLVVSGCSADIESAGHIRNLDRIISASTGVDRKVIQNDLLTMCTKHFA